MSKIKKEIINNLIIYETPRISKYIWFKWGQEIMAKYIMWNINKKLKKYNEMIKIEKKFKK
jgi:hypothetical protein